jgi:hypothetical protein
MYIALGFFSFIFFWLLIIGVGYVVFYVFKTLYFLVNQSFEKMRNISTDEVG